MLQPLAKPVKLLRPPVPNTVDPFGHTLLHHTPGMVFEVSCESFVTVYDCHSTWSCDCRCVADCGGFELHTRLTLAPPPSHKVLRNNHIATVTFYQPL
jgi:hypothetical protein